MSRHLLAIALSVLLAHQTSFGAVVGTQAAIDLDARINSVERVRDLLAHEQVRDMLLAMGVAPEHAANRVASLTDAELATLQHRLEELPAGATGIIEVIGIVAIVLIILELVGVIDIFKKV